MIDTNRILKEAQDELANETSSKARGRLVAKLREIKAAEKVLANLKAELQMIVIDLQD
jgi:hypothetical protein